MSNLKQRLIKRAKEIMKQQEIIFVSLTSKHGENIKKYWEEGLVYVYEDGFKFKFAIKDNSLSIKEV